MSSLVSKAPDATENILRLKTWRVKPDDYFTANLTLGTCVQIFEATPKRDFAVLYGYVIQFYHERLNDPTKCERAKDWADDKILSFSMFKSREEWSAFFENPQNLGQHLAKKTPAECGIKTEYVEWARAIWLKLEAAAAAAAIQSACR